MASLKSQLLSAVQEAKKAKPSGAVRRAARRDNDGLAGVIVANIKKRLKDCDSVSLLSDANVLSDVTEWIPTTFPNIDQILGGGLPVGRVSEVSGPEASGKSAFSHACICGVQRMGGLAVVEDFETSLERSKMRQLKIREDQLIYANPSSMDEGWDILWSLLDTLATKPPDKPVLFVWDSVAMARTKAELELKSASDVTMASQARMMSVQCSNKLVRKVAQCRVHVMFVNQLRDKMNAPKWGDKDETPGGRALKFAAALRVRFSKVATLPQVSGAPKTGYLVKVTTKKCKVAPPHRSTTFVVDFKYGPSPAVSAWELLRASRVLKPARAGKVTVPFAVQPEEVYDRSLFVDTYLRDAAFRNAANKAMAEQGAKAAAYERSAADAAGDDAELDEDDE